MKATAVRISSRDELEIWLERKPRIWSQIVALRCSWLVLPLACDFKRWKEGKVGVELVSSVFRASAVASAAMKVPAAAAAYAAATAASNAASSSDFISSASAESAGQAAAAAAARPATYAAYAASAAAGSAAWEMVEKNCRALESGADVVSVLHMPVGADAPDWWNDAWDAARRWLSASEDGFDIWREWYHGRVQGLPRAFKDFDEVADEAFYRWVVERDDVWWKRAAGEVNADVRAKVDQLRLSELPSEDTNHENDENGNSDGYIAQVMADTSSPVITWINGALTLVTSEVFAEERSLSREALKKRLLETARFLENCANRNAPPNLSGAFRAYKEHLYSNWDLPDPETLDIYASVVGSLRRNPEYEDWADGIGIATDKFLKDHRAFITDTPGITEQTEKRGQIVPRNDVDFAEAVGKFQHLVAAIIGDMEQSGLARDNVIAHLKAQVDLAADMRFGPEPEATLDDFLTLPPGWTPQTRTLANIGGTYVSLRQNVFEGIALADIGITARSSEAYLSFISDMQPKIDKVSQLLTALFRVA